MNPLKRVRRAALPVALSTVLVGLVVPSAALAGPLSLPVARVVSQPGVGTVTQDLDGDNLVWTESVSGDNELFYSNLAAGTVVRVTNNTGTDGFAQISGTRMVWLDNSDGDFDVAYWNAAIPATPPIKVQSNVVVDSDPQIDGSLVAWTSVVGDSEIRAWAGPPASSYPITNNDVSDTEPRIDGNLIVWMSSQPDSWEIYCLNTDTSQVTRVTTNSWTDRMPDVDEGMVSWYSSGFLNNDEFVSWTPATGVWLVGDKVGNESFQELDADGGLVVYRTTTGGPEPTFSLWVWEPALGGAPVRIVQSLGAVDFSLDAPYVVFATRMAGGTTPMELFAWDRSSRTVSQLTGNPALEEWYPTLSGAQIAWTRTDAAARVVWTGSLQKSAATIAIKAPATCAFGGPAKLSGSVKWGSEPLAGRTVKIQSRTKTTDAWSNWKTVTTDALGAWKVTASPKRKTYYRAAFAGDAAFAAGVSSSKAVLPRVSLSGPGGVPSPASRMKTYTAYGTLKPRHSAGTYPVRIKCYRKVGSAWVLKKTYRARVRTISSSASKYSARVRLGTAGSWRIRAYYPGTGSNAETKGAWKYIKVK